MEKTSQNNSIAKPKLQAADLTKMGLLTAIMVIMAQMSIVLPFSVIPVTLGTIAVNLIALVLKPRQAFMVMVVYMMLGVIGLPVFSGGGAGIGRFIAPSGGYLISYLYAVPLMSFLKGYKNDLRRFILVTVFIGVPLINLSGSLHMILINSMGIKAALMSGTVPFLPGDAAKAVISSIIAIAINQALRLTEK